MNALIGYTGFVGQNLCRFFYFDEFYNSQNFKEMKNREFNTIFFAGLPAKKWYANLHPEEDWQNIQEIMSVLETVKAKKFVLISTIDVYHQITGSCQIEIQPEENHVYGKNRYLFEQFVKEKFSNYLIVRLPALFGKGLKKNVIYDLMNNNQVEKIKVNSRFQWYNLDWLGTDIKKYLDQTTTVNLFTEPLHTKEIFDLFDYFGNPENKLIEYNLKPVNGYCYTKERVLESIKEFVQLKRPDNLCVSNIFLNKLSMFQFQQILKLYGLGFEIAPTKFATWQEIYQGNLNLSIKPYSFQSVTYLKTGLDIFDETQDLLIDHLKKVLETGKKYGIKRVVFGCPKNRKFQDDILPAIHFFKKIGNICQENDIIMCIEPNAKEYGCNFVNNLDEAYNLVKLVNHPNIRMMVDSGNLMMEKDNLQNVKKYLHLIEHIHISCPYMEPLFNLDNTHRELAKMLDGYKGKITLEQLMKDDSPEELDQCLQNFIKLF